MKHQEALWAACGEYRNYCSYCSYRISALVSSKLPAHEKKGSPGAGRLRGFSVLMGGGD